MITPGTPDLCSPPIALLAGEPRWPARIARVFGAGVTLLGLAVLAGWLFDIRSIKSVVPGLAEMKANTALGFLLAGTALMTTAWPDFKGRKRIGNSCSFAIIALGLATAFEYATGFDLGIDELLFADPLGPTRWGLPAGRMAIGSALAFVIAGCSLLLLRGRATVISQLLACATALAAVFSLAGYLCQELAITGMSPFTSLALHTAGGFIALAVGLLAAAPPRGPVTVLMSSSRSGLVARMLLPTALAATLGFGALAAAGQRAGWYEATYGIALFALISAAVLGTVIWSVAHLAMLSEDAARASADQVYALNEGLERRVAERTAELQAATASLRVEVDERRRAEQAEFLTRTQLSDAIECLDAGLVMFGPDERLVVCNSKYKEIYAMCAGAIVPGARYEDIIRASCRAGVHLASGIPVEEWTALRLAQHRNPGEPTEKKLDGRWIRIGDRRTSDGGVVSLRTDITSLKNAQEAAEAANRAKSEFLANMSHEIRTPMNGVLGMTQLALDTDLTPEQRGYLATVMASGEHLLKVIEDILDFSKIEAGKLDIDAQAFSLRDCVGETMKALAVRASAEGLSLTCVLPPDMPEHIVGDAHRLRQVLVNLLGNAIKFTLSGGVVLEIAIEEESPESVRLRFDVRDSGIGIPGDRLAAIFQAFIQSDGSTTRRYGGTGLGLTISAQLVELMGGHLAVQSEVGRGSTFSFSLRFGQFHGCPPRLAIGKGQAYAPFPSRVLRFLIAEDNEVNRELIVAVLGKRGHSIVEVHDGRAAVEACEAQTFDVMLMDVQMPEMDGLTATASIREREKTTGRHIPIIALTAHAMRGDRERCLAAGMDAYLSKPVRFEELFALLEELVPPAAELRRIFKEPAAIDHGDSSFDRRAAMAQVEGDRPLLAKMVGIFQGQSAKLLDEIGDSIARNDATGLQRAAHKLKGSLGSFGASAAAAKSALLENTAARGDWTQSKTICVELEAEVAFVRHSLTEFIEEGVTCVS